MYKVERADSDHSSFLKEAMDRFSNNEPDMFLVSKEGFKIYTTRSLLSLYSKNMARLLSSIPCCLSTSVSLPVSSNAINNLLRILYKGEATAYEEKDLALVNEAAELLGIILGDYNIRINKEEEETNNLTDMQDVNIFAETNCLESDHLQKSIESDHFQESLLLENVAEEPENTNIVVKVEISSEIIDDKEMLGELVDKMEADSGLDKQMETDSELVEQMEADNELIEEMEADSELIEQIEADNELVKQNEAESDLVKQIESSKEIPADQITKNNSMDKVQSLVEEVEGMGANIETLAEELNIIDDEKNDNEPNIDNEENIEDVEKMGATIETLAEELKQIDNGKKIEEKSMTLEARNVDHAMPEIDASKEESSKPKKMDKHFMSSKPTADNNKNINIEMSSKNKNILERQLSPKHTTEDKKIIEANKEQILNSINILKKKISPKHVIEDIKNINVNQEHFVKVEPPKKQINDTENMDIKNQINGAKNMDISHERYQKIDNLLEKQISENRTADTKNIVASNNVQELQKNTLTGKTKCDICFKWFKRPQGLERHIIKFHAGENKTTLDTPKNIDEKPMEKKDLDNRNEEVACKYCGQVFRSATSNYPLLVAKADLQKHIIKHLKNKEIIIPPSEIDLPKTKNSPRTNKIFEHASSHLSKDMEEDLVKPIQNVPDEDRIIKEYNCNMCTKSFSTKEVLAVHKKTHQPKEKTEVQEKFTCHKCGKCFSRVDKLEKHMLFHDPKPIESKASLFKCDMCDKSFAKMDRLHLHRSYHTTFEQQNPNLKVNLKVSCDQCDKQLESSQSLQDHKLKFHLKMKEVVTGPLNVKFPTKSDDAVFLDVAKNEMNSQSFFTCEKCSESFVNMEDLETHRQTSHEMQECNGCDKVFESETDLMEHIVVHINGSNGESSSDSVEQNIAPIVEEQNEMSKAMDIETVGLLHCSICDIIFSNEDMLKIHNRAHSEEMLLTVRMPNVDITKNNVLFLTDFD